MLQHEGFVGQDLGDRAGRDDPACVKDDDRIADLGHELKIMGGDDFGGRDAAENGHQPPPAPRIEGPGRFVQSQHLGLAGQDAGQADPLLFAVAQMLRRAALESLQTDVGQGLADGRIRFRRGPAPLPGAESHILADGR